MVLCTCSYLCVQCFLQLPSSGFLLLSLEFQKSSTSKTTYSGKLDLTTTFSHYSPSQVLHDLSPTIITLKFVKCFCYFCRDGAHMCTAIPQYPGWGGGECGLGSRTRCGYQNPQMLKSHSEPSIYMVSHPRIRPTLDPVLSLLSAVG